MSDQLSWPRLAALLRNDFLRVHRSVLLILGTVAVLGPGGFGRQCCGRQPSARVALQRVVHRHIVRLGHRCDEPVVHRSARPCDEHGAAAVAGVGARENAVRLLLMTVGSSHSVSVFTTVLSWVLEGINGLVFGVSREIYTPLDGAWVILPHYLVVQSLFFSGAAWFRKLNYIKTIGSALVIASASALSASRSRGCSAR